MPRNPRTSTLALTLAALGSLSGGIGPAGSSPLCAAGRKISDSQTVRKLFSHPPREYSTGPLWVWNDRLTSDEIRSTLEDLAAQDIRQVWVHPRPGLMTPYLSQEWFARWKDALREAERLDMNVWIYDENSYPSGFAGGLVPEAMPEARGQGLHFHGTEAPPAVAADTFAVWSVDPRGTKDVTADLREGKKLAKGPYLVASRRVAGSSGWFGGWYYVDLIRPGVTEKFLEITLGAYEREVGSWFGKRIPGVFTDEPHLTPAGGIHWSDRLPELFKKRWGYDLVPALPSLVRPLGDWKKVRHDFHRLLLEQFIEHWARPYHDACEKRGLEFTGHYWEHGWPGASHGGDNMAMYAWHQRPGIDCLMNEYSESTNAQFGNARSVKELSSVANQLGQARTFCEAYGAAGWDLRFEDMKRIGDWLYVLGVNTLDEHLSYVTIRGARKRDHPQSFSYHEPWWSSYHLVASYFTRLSLALSSGEQVNEVLVIEPTTTAWLYQPDASTHKALALVGDRFQDLVNRLERAHVEYDIGCEDIIGRHGSVEGDRFRVGRRAYSSVVLSPLTENLEEATAKLLEQFVENGGRVIACGLPPARVDGAPSGRLGKLARKASWEAGRVAEVVEKLAGADRDGFSIRLEPEKKGLLFHHRRKLSDGELVFLVNTSDSAPSGGRVTARGGSVERWDPETGAITPLAHRSGSKAGQVTFAFELPPAGSLLAFVSQEARESPPSAAEGAGRRIEPAGPIQIRRIEPNVLTLDYIDVSVGKESRTSVYCWEASRFVFQQHGFKEGNPWDSAVQFRDRLITKTFPEKSGFEATFRFRIRDSVPRDLQAVVERPDLYRITLNGKPVKAIPGAWWLDRAFGRIDIAREARAGENRLTLAASPMTMEHELEPVYILGDFSLEAAERGFTIAPARPLGIAPGPRGDGEYAGWKSQGCPFYAAGVAYTEEFDLPKVPGRTGVLLSSWLGSVARVRVNGEEAGVIWHRPWELDITSRLRPGRNRVEVTVVGTLKNTLGPHHAGAVTGRAWPGMFHRAPASGPPPGSEYHTLEYGLFEPFALRVTAR